MNILISIIAVWVYMSGWYLVGKKLKRWDIADVAWGLGFILIALLNFGGGTRNIVMIYLIGIWGGRLTYHIFMRNKNKKEDPRYEQFKDSPYVKVFMVQGGLMLLVAMPILMTVPGWTLLNSIGAWIWMAGFAIESIADWQLKQFIGNPKNKGKIMDRGLWAYSRHPNYLGEIIMWWAIFIVSLGGGKSILGIIGPLTISYLIIFVSGIPLLEKKYAGNKEFEAYKKRVPVIVPGWRIFDRY